MAGEANIISKVSIDRVKSIVASVMGGVSEAPIDGQQYARQNGAWAVVVGGSDATEFTKGIAKLFPSITDSERTDGAPTEKAITDHINKSNFGYTFESEVGIIGNIQDYHSRPLLEKIIYRLKPSHTVGTGGSNYTKALETITTYSKGELWIKFTGSDFTATLERKIAVTTGTLSTITPSVSRSADFERFKKLIPKFRLRSGTGAATVDVQLSVQNPKTMAETRVYVERWELDDATTFGDKPWYPPRLSTKYLNSLIGHPFKDRFFLLGVSGTLNDADFEYEKVQASYATIITKTVKGSEVNERGYFVIPFVCEPANCLQITLNNSLGSSVITDQFVILKT